MEIDTASIGPATATIRSLNATDWPTAAAIYSEGIAAGMATFETTVPSWEDFDAGRLALPRLVAEISGEVMGWAALSPVSKRECYRGVAEFSIYLAGKAHGRGLGSALLDALIRESESQGIWTLQAAIFPQNEASIRLVEKYGFRLVGRRERIARLRGEWQDTLIYERRSTKTGI